MVLAAQPAHIDVRIPAMKPVVLVLCWLALWVDPLCAQTADQKQQTMAALPKDVEEAAEEEEANLPLKPPRPRTTPLRGGIGSG